MHQLPQNLAIRLKVKGDSNIFLAENWFFYYGKKISKVKGHFTFFVHQFFYTFVSPSRLGIHKSSDT